MKTTKFNFLTKRLRGFTLIELLVVIGIIGLLAGIVFVALGPVRAKARDAQRMADLTQVQLMLSIYEIDKNSYPLSTQEYEIEDHAWGSYWDGYGTVPTDPLSSQTYAYVSDGSSFQLYAKFEKEPVKAAFACEACGPDSEYNGGLASSGSTLLAFETPPLGEEEEEEEEEEPPIVLAQGRQVYYISASHSSPQMMEAVIDPLDVKVGDTQIMSITIRDTYPIQLVEAKVETDTGIKTYTLSLIEGTDTDGRWQGSWTVHDTHSATYRTTFKATNTNNETSSVTLTWTDACVPGPGDDWYLDGICGVSGVNGVDNGDFYVVPGSDPENPYAITIQANTTFVWNPGKSIYLQGGSIVINSTGELRQTNLWMTDADSDSYPANLTQYAQDDAPTNGRRRNLMLTISSVDYNDNSAIVYPGQCCNGGCSINNSNGTCGARDAGETGCTGSTGSPTNLAACQRCNGSSLTSVNISTFDDSEGSNTCAGTCAAYCSSGSCINTDTGEGTCTVATDVRVASGGDGHCASADCAGDCSANGIACSVSGDCCSNYCYIDADGDRYSPASGTKTCRANSQLAGEDCYDVNSSARPGQTTYYQSHRGDGSFDYNCDEVDEKNTAICYSATIGTNPSGVGCYDNPIALTCTGTGEGACGEPSPLQCCFLRYYESCGGTVKWVDIGDTYTSLYGTKDPYDVAYCETYTPTTTCTCR